ncbi:phage distal tail protein [Congzhengia minquanensis]|nr:phage tail domain-containing protein [Congzhengia minquanensis]
MNITFQNDFGKILMTGGGKGPAWKIKEITGLGIPEKSFAYNTFAGVAGQELSSVSVLARTITMNVDIDCRFPQISMSRAACILNADGVLTIHHGTKHRAISCRCTSFTKTEKKAAFFEATLQFVADNPYFHDCEEKRVVISRKNDKLTFPFHLPVTFSERVNSTDLVVSGEEASEPVIYIFGDDPENTDYDDNSITIVNKTANAFLKLNYKISYGEQIKIDIPNREITSNLRERMFQYLSDDSFFSSFVLLSGANEIECRTNVRINAYILFQNNYLEAMY